MRKLFRVGDLFDIHPTSAYKMRNSELFSTAGSTPILSNSFTNNGIGGYCGLKPTEAGGIITFSDTTTGADTMFYQPDPFIGYPHVQGMYPYQPDKWNEKCCLYVISVIRKSAGDGWSYAVKFNRNLVKNFIIELPVIESGDPNHEYTVDDIDYGYMQERITELEQERITELDAYLAASGFDDYELTEEDKKLLSLSPTEASDEANTAEISRGNGQVKFKSFTLGNIFKISSPKKRFNANTVQFGGKYPYIARGSSNNGIRGYITEDVQFLNPAKSLTFGQDTATVFYQPDAYFTGDKIKVLILKKHNINEQIAQYFITAIAKAFSSFTWGQNSFNEKILKSTEIILPVQESLEINHMYTADDIDYGYMENYINAIEKLAIADVVKYKDKVIDTTKQLVEAEIGR